MLFINGSPIPEMSGSKLTIFGNGTVSGIAEIAIDNHGLSDERFHVNNLVIPIIGDERFVRTSGFQPKTGLDMFDYLRMMQPPGLITFGVNGPSSRKPYGTHLDIFLREYAKVGMISAAIEGVYDDTRELALANIAGQIGSKVITMSVAGEEIHIET